LENIAKLMCMPPSRSDEQTELQYAARALPANCGDRLLDVILRAGIDHRHVCGGNGFCTSCRVEVIDTGEGLSPVSSLERDRLGADAGRLRLACQATIHGRAAVRVPLPGPSRFSPDG
ncbi:MAG: 2Fe-2S iron-sulfur cluster-binding protein, partial [Chloroflexota bacterium]